MPTHHEAVALGVRSAVLGVFLSIVAPACAGPATQRSPGSGGAGSGGDGGGRGGSPGTPDAGSGGTSGGAGGGAGHIGAGGDLGAAGGRAMGGGGAGGSPSGGVAGGGGASGQVATGTCGISRRISLPPVSEEVRSRASIRRAAGGFVVGPNEGVAGTSSLATVNWLRVDPTGEVQTTYAATYSKVDGTVGLLNIGAPTQVIRIGVGSGDFADFNGAQLNDGGTALASPTMLVHAFNRVTAYLGVSQSLDGQRGLFTVSHPGVQTPLVMVVGATGARIGDTQTTGTPLTDTWDCSASLPTEHGGAFSQLEGAAAPLGDETFHLLELGPDGAIGLDARIPVRWALPPGWNGSRFCPLQALTGSGFAFLVAESSASGGTISWHLHRIGRDATSTDEVWDTLPGFPRAFAIVGQTTIALCAAKDGIVIVKRTNGQDQQFSLAPRDVGDAGAVVPIASEAGAMFLDVRPLDPLGSASDARKIVEITCP